MVEHENLSLLTDLYQLTMAQAYFREGQTGRATFSLFVRTYPSNRGYFVAAGLHDALEYLENLHFDKEALDYLDSLGLFSDDFIHYLSGLRFTGDVYAIQEGQVFFAHEPVLEVTAPVIEAQIVETFLINQIHLQTVIATKAARCVDAAGKRASAFQPAVRPDVRSCVQTAAHPGKERPTAATRPASAPATTASPSASWWARSSSASPGAASRSWCSRSW